MSASVSTNTATTPALKEWGAIAAALLDGRQTLLLRKGGIHEKRFEVSPPGTEQRAGQGFVLFPTVAHSHAERVRPEHTGVLEVGARDVRDEVFTVRCGLTLVEVIEVRRPEGLAAIEDLHIWTAESVRTDRLEFRPRHPLRAMVVRAFELPEPFILRRRPEYGGCRSWLDLPVAWDGCTGRQVQTEERLAGDAARVRSAFA
ncbi:MAG: DUF1802 family protein [Actinobacteria bacterium]|nr:DUF1802 family protein [Actinomycetota bacterium]